MDGGPHQGALHRPPLLQRLRQCVAAEVRQAGPQADVGGRSVLGLEAGDALDGPIDREIRPLQQELPCQHGPVQLPGGEDVLGQRRT
jgi:hypothetical protein